MDVDQVLKQVLPFRIKLMRKARGLSQRRAAVAIGCATTTINELESGQCRKLQVHTLLRVCQALECSPDFLLGLSEIEQNISAKTEVAAA